MKLFSALLFTFSLFGQTYAQHQYIPFPTENTVWVERSLDENGNQDWIGQSYTIRDTTINGLEYAKIQLGVDTNLMHPSGFGELWLAVRNDTANKKVYVIDRNSGGVEKLYYDFDVNPGDTIPITSYKGEARYGNTMVTKVDTIRINFSSRLVIYTEQFGGNPLRPYIEGIGSVAGLWSDVDLFEGKWDLICMMDASVKSSIWTNPGLEDMCKLHPITVGISDLNESDVQFRIYPNPINTNSRIELKSSNNKIQEIRIYDGLGRLIEEIKHIEYTKAQIGQYFHQAGIYLVQIQLQNGEVATKCLIKF